MAILLLGLLGIAALIPIGKMAMTETEKSDRTGACGRAAIHDVKIQRMLAWDNWTTASKGQLTLATPVFTLDPLGYAALGTTTLGGGTISRVTLNNIVANDVFLWHDDLTFGLPKDLNTDPPRVGDRPVPPLISTSPDVWDTGAYAGHCSWFLTVTPSPSDVIQNVPWAQRRQFDVSVVVCWNREFTTGANAGETLVPNVTCDSATGIGGIGISFSGNTPTLKEDEWVLLTSNNSGQATWYRVVSAGVDDSSGTATTRATLVGPDWNGGTGTDIQLIVIKGVTGVYTTTLRVDDEGIWTQ